MHKICKLEGLCQGPGKCCAVSWGCTGSREQEPGGAPRALRCLTGGLGGTVVPVQSNFPQGSDFVEPGWKTREMALEQLDAKTVVKTAFSNAVEKQYPLAAENVARLRRVHPEKTPAELIAYVDKFYLGAVTTTGAGAGAAAIVPNGWVQVPVAAAELVTFLEASVLYALSVAEIHGVHAEDAERRRLLVMSVLVGDAAVKKAVEPIIGRSVPYWGRAIVNSIPISAINNANKVLGPRFITKYGTKQGVLVLGKQMPMLIGVGVGAAGNGAFGWFVIRSARKILGPSPDEWGATDDGGADSSPASPVGDTAELPPASSVDDGNLFNDAP